jgi:hypothetical protein
LSAREKGYVVVWTPYAKLTYRAGFESARPSKQDTRTFEERWKAATRGTDPYYSAHLTDRKEDFSILDLKRKRTPLAQEPAIEIDEVASAVLLTGHKPT